MKKLKMTEEVLSRHFAECSTSQFHLIHKEASDICAVFLSITQESMNYTGDQWIQNQVKAILIQCAVGAWGKKRIKDKYAEV